MRNPEHLERARSAVERVLGTSVLGVLHRVPAVNGHADLELVGQVLAAPDRALQTLVDGLPGALGADWAALVRGGADGGAPLAVITSLSYPGPEEMRLSATARLGSLGMVRIGDREPCGSGGIAPIGTTGLALLVVREHGLGFHQSELARLGEIGSIAARVANRLIVPA